MMDGVRTWLLGVISASLLCALADCLMPSGAVKRVGRLVCGLVLLCAVLSPVPGLDLEGGGAWLEGYFSDLDTRRGELEQQVNEGMKVIIEEKCAAYIVDKAAQLGLSCTARVECRVGEDGLFVPERTRVDGRFTDVEQSRLTQLVSEDLGVPPERQAYYSEEELP